MLLEFCRDIRRLRGRSPSGEPFSISVTKGDLCHFVGFSNRAGWLIALDGSGNRYQVQLMRDVNLCRSLQPRRRRRVA